MTARILGLAKLDRKLKALPEAMRDKIRVAMAVQADEMVAMMKRLVPEDQGDLMASIGWQWGSKAPKGSIAVGSISDGGGLTLTIFAGNDTDAYHARFVEFGTVKMASQPFFFVSYRARKKTAVRRIRKAVRDAARQVAAG